MKTEPEGIYFVNDTEFHEFGGAEIIKTFVLIFEMDYNDWLIAQKSKEFQDFVEHIKYRTAYRYSPEIKTDDLYRIKELTECGHLHSVQVSFSLASHDWLKLKVSKAFQNLVSYLWELETRDIRHDIR